MPSYRVYPPDIMYVSATEKPVARRFTSLEAAIAYAATVWKLQGKTPTEPVVIGLGTGSDWAPVGYYGHERGVYDASAPAKFVAA